MNAVMEALREASKCPFDEDAAHASLKRAIDFYRADAVFLKLGKAQLSPGEGRKDVNAALNQIRKLQTFYRSLLTPEMSAVRHLIEYSWDDLPDVKQEIEQRNVAIAKRCEGTDDYFDRIEGRPDLLYHDVTSMLRELDKVERRLGAALECHGTRGRKPGDAEPLRRLVWSLADIYEEHAGRSAGVSKEMATGGPFVALVRAAMEASPILDRELRTPEGLAKTVQDMLRSRRDNANQ